MTNPIASKYLYFSLMLILGTPLSAQNMHKDKMENLNFMIGEWVGTTKVFENGRVVKEGTAYEKISYDLGKSIVVIELNTEFLQLRTIINYSEDDRKYYYHRFSKSGAAIYPAEYKNGQLIVWKDNQTRFFFTRTPDGKFQEYGEKMVDGNWVKYFEDTFMNTQ